MSDPDYKGRPWSYGIIAVIITFMCSTIGFVYFATTQKVDLVTKKYYEHSIGYDSVMASQERGFSEGEIQIKLSPLEVLVEKTPSVEIANVSVILYRPSDSAFDQKFDVVFDSTGKYFVPLAQIKSGYWRVQLSWQTKGETYQREWPWMKK